MQAVIGSGGDASCDDRRDAVVHAAMRWGPVSHRSLTTDFATADAIIARHRHEHPPMPEERLMTATYDAFVLDEMMRRRPGKIMIALLAMAAKGDHGAMAIVGRHTDATLMHEGGRISALFEDRGCEWNGDKLRVPYILPDTVTGLLAGRRVDEVVDVAAGGHLKIRHVEVSGKATYLVCPDHPAYAPHVGIQAHMRARLLLAHTSVISYASVIKASRAGFILFYIVVLALLFQVAPLTAIRLHPPAMATAILTTIVVLPVMAMVALPPPGWRSEMLYRMRGC